MCRRGESIYKRKDGRWEARYIHHYENGVAKYRYIYAHSYMEVKEKRLQELSQPDKVTVSNIKSIAKFGEISRLWLSEIRSNVKESTYTRYFRIVDHYLNPDLESIMIIKLDSKILRNYSVKLQTSGGKNGSRLSNKTVNDILCVLKSIFKLGKENGYPCADLSKIKMMKYTNNKPQILSYANLKLIEESILNSELFENDFRIKLGILLTLYTGLRIGELCGLRHSDIDMKERIVSISRTVQRISDLSSDALTKTTVMINKPKTESALRTIPIPTFLANLLSLYIENDDSYLLTGTDKFTEPHQFYMRYKTFMKRLGLQEYTFHSLRHSFATRCIDLGFDAKSLSEILGHSNVTTTLSLYVHPTLEQKRKLIERLKS